MMTLSLYSDLGAHSSMPSMCRKIGHACKDAVSSLEDFLRDEGGVSGSWLLTDADGNFVAGGRLPPGPKMANGRKPIIVTLMLSCGGRR